MGLIPKTMTVKIDKDALLGEGGTLCALQALIAKAHAELNQQAITHERTLVGKPMMQFGDYPTSLILLSKYHDKED